MLYEAAREGLLDVVAGVYGGEEMVEAGVHVATVKGVYGLAVGAVGLGAGEGSLELWARCVDAFGGKARAVAYYIISSSTCAGSSSSSISGGVASGARVSRGMS